MATSVGEAVNTPIPLEDVGDEGVGAVAPDPGDTNEGGTMPPTMTHAQLVSLIATVVKAMNGEQSTASPKTKEKEVPDLTRQKKS